MASLEYKLIMQPDFDKFTESVNRHLFVGWSLVGGVSITHVPTVESGLVFAQAVTQKKK